MQELERLMIILSWPELLTLGCTMNARRVEAAPTPRAPDKIHGRHVPGLIRRLLSVRGCMGQAQSGLHLVL